MATTKKPTQADEILDAAEHVVGLWMEFRKFFRKAFTSDPITQAEEQTFLRIKSDMSRYQRILGQRVPAGFKYGHKRITDIMAKSISIAALREQPLQDKKNLYAQWHESYVALQNLLGVLDIMREGFPVKFETATVKKTGNVKADLASSSGKKKGGGAGKALKAIIALAVIGAAAYYFLVMNK